METWSGQVYCSCAVFVIKYKEACFVISFQLIEKWREEKGYAGSGLRKRDVFSVQDSVFSVQIPLATEPLKDL